MRVRRRSAGLSLVEVLIAIVVITLGLLAVSGTFGWVSSSNAKIRYQKVASELIESELNALECKPILPKENYTYTRNVGQPQSTLPEDALLTVNSEPYPDASELRLRRVTVEVRWGSNGDPQAGRLARERLICLR
jgi:Tfp pilus assembly protein PilV